MKLQALVTGTLIALSFLLVACGDEAPRAAPAPTAAPAKAAPEVPRSAAAALSAPAPTRYRLTILHNNNGDSQLMDLGPDLEDFGGVAQFAAVVNREKESASSGDGDAVGSGVIMLSSGDNFVASPEFDVGRRAGTFYDALALDLIGYDAIGLGSHDFDFGPDVLADFIKQVSTSRTPFLSSNLDFSREPVLNDLLDEGRIAKSVVVEKNGGKIGVIGAILPTLGDISSPRRVNVIRDVAREVQAEVDRLEASGVNKIVLVSHQHDLNADIALVGRVHGVDVVVTGGGYELLANECDLLIPGDDTPFGPYPIMATDQRGDRVPMVTTSGRYAYLGKLVVIFDTNGRLVDVDQDASRPIRIAREDNPFAVQTDIENCRRQAEFRNSVLAGQIQREVLGPLKNGLDALAQPVANSQVNLDGRLSEVRSRETNQGSLMADALLWQAGLLALDNGAAEPDVAIQNGGGIRNDSLLPPGPIRELDTLAMAPFSNMVTVVEEISRSQFKEVLENAVSRAVDGDTAGGTGRFAQISGFRFEWSESGTAQVLNPDGSVRVPGTRVQRVVLSDGEVMVGGGRVVPGPDLTVATIDFLARGGDEYPFRGAHSTVLGVSYQQALTNYLQLPAGLDGVVTAADYPAGGEGRIKRLP